MKAITLTQPWATAVALGAKRIETRSWGTRYRGPLAIHAAKGFRVGELIHQGCCWGWCGVLRPTGYKMGGGPTLDKILPFGAVIGTCRLVDCRPTGSFTVDELHTKRRPEGEESTLYDWTEKYLGDFSPGRWGWVLEEATAMAPVRCAGARGIWVWKEPLPFELETWLSPEEYKRGYLMKPHAIAPHKPGGARLIPLKPND